MNKKIIETNAVYNMFGHGDTIVVAVSGGADSMALLHLLHSLQKRFSLTLYACHVHHGLRGAEADRDEAFVRAECARLGIELHIFRVNVRAECGRTRQTVEECARTLRYQCFSLLAGEKQASVATAHTASDAVETMLFHLARGTGGRGLTGIPPVRESGSLRVVRPLIRCFRAEVEGYCHENGVAFVTDSSNLSDVFSRNRIRHAVVPALRETHPGAEENIFHAITLLQQDEEYLTCLAREALSHAQRKDGYDAEILFQMPLPLKGRAAALLLRGNGLSVSRTSLNAFVEVAEGRRKRTQAAPCAFWERAGGIIRLMCAQKEHMPFTIPFSLGEISINPHLLLSIDVQDYEKYEENTNVSQNPFLSVLDYDKIEENAVFRCRLSGDRITLPKRKVTKTLKKLFNEAKIPVYNRNAIPVLADDKGVLWVHGFGVDARAAVGSHTARVVVLSAFDPEKR